MPAIFEAKELNVHINRISSGEVGWQSPSNIAIVKYWGKYGKQLPQNTSISLTLANSCTETHIEYEVQDYLSEEPRLEFYFEGKPHEAFRQKIFKSIQKNIHYIPFVKHLHLTIDSKNSFPHSSGIASSASSMSALALCLCTIEQQLFSGVLGESEFYQKASFLARLFSGSASRSVFREVAIWGKLEQLENSSELYAVRFSNFHERFDDYHDDIVIVNSREKPVSSRKGHQLMDIHPFANARYKQADQNAESLLEILRKGDVWEFGKLAEQEAMTLHALMMSSDPSYILIEPNTLKIIQEIRKYRQENRIPVFFTMDAGPNVHILYPDEFEGQVKQFIKGRVLELSPERRVIEDHMGKGPVLLVSSFKTSGI